MRPETQIRNLEINEAAIIQGKVVNLNKMKCYLKQEIALWVTFTQASAR